MGLEIQMSINLTEIVEDIKIEFFKIYLLYDFVLTKCCNILGLISSEKINFN